MNLRHYTSVELDAYESRGRNGYCTQLRSEVPFFLHDGDLVWFLHRYLVSGDYSSNGTVGLSNVESFRERFSEDEYDEESNPDGLWFERFESHGGRIIAIRALSPEMYEALESLEDYPLLDDDDHSQREMDLIEECWDSYGKEDLKRAMAKRSPELEEAIEALSDDEMYNLRRAFEENANVNPNAETSVSVHFYTEEMVKAWDGKSLRYTENWPHTPVDEPESFDADAWAESAKCDNATDGKEGP